MKFLHLADLHLGRSYEGISLLEDQRAVLCEITQIARDERPDAVLIAGDIYDRSLPPESAVTMLDDFLLELLALCPVFVIAGNHDSGERLSYMSRLAAAHGLHICGRLTGRMEPIALGDTDVYLLPYTHPAEAKAFGLVGEDVPARMEDVVRAIVQNRVTGNGKRSLLVAHLFVTSGGAGPEESKSEREPVGTLENVDVSVFDDFDYVALGHIHGPQRIGRDTVRYAGTPLPYSFSEEHHKKSVCLYDPDAENPVRLVPLHAGRKMRVVTGYMAELLQPDFDKGDHSDFVLAVLRDADIQVDAQARLSAVYENVRVTYENLMREGQKSQWQLDEGKLDDPLALFEAFFETKKERALSESERGIVRALLQKSAEEGTK